MPLHCITISEKIERNLYDQGVIKLLFVVHLPGEVMMFTFSKSIIMFTLVMHLIFINLEDFQDLLAFKKYDNIYNYEGSHSLLTHPSMTEDCDISV